MELKEIQELIKMMGKSKLAEIKIKNGDFELVLRSESTKDKVSYVTAQMPAMMQVAGSDLVSAPSTEKKPAENIIEAKPDSSQLLEIKSPMVGTFYRSPSPEKPPYVKIGDAISEGDVVCMIEAMKLFNEIESEVTGTIVKIMVEDATPVEYDQVLFLIEPA
ncbi:MAG: acetyl-CoA carboxylase biotin carboxyl carrier protein [Saprospiraceae bacterium]